jgi:hypothetical protein
MPLFTFTRSLPGTYSALTDTWSAPTETTITAEGIILPRGDPQRYAALGLVASASPTLFLAPTDYERRAFTPEFILPGDSVVINDLTFVVKDVEVLAPDGVVITARVIVSK